MTSIRWGNTQIGVVIGIGADRPATIDSLDVAGRERTSPARQPLVELLLLGDGRTLNNTRFTSTGVGARLRHVSHRTVVDDQKIRLIIVQRDDATGLTTSSTLTAYADVPTLQIHTTVRNTSDDDRIVQMISSLALGCVLDDGESLDDLVLHSAQNSWCAESRWSSVRLRSDEGLGRIAPPDWDIESRSYRAAVSTSTWSTGSVLPTAMIDNTVTGRALAWQIEHNGAWRWEVDGRWMGVDEVAVIAGGPNDVDHHWTIRLAPGEEFATVPTSVAVSREGWQGAIAALTAHRRAIRGPLVRPDLPVILNDYMNALMGDPTTEKLLPLIDAAAEIGAEYFCIDAGWYDDGGHWWPSVGDWQPSTSRFPDGGLQRVLDHIRDRGMLPGLWVEPEVIGVRSPAAERLPDEAFLQRYGRRIVEQERYFLDLRHPAARAHLDEVVDRLVDHGARFFKFDYNVTPGPGTDRDAFSVGDGLLQQNRAQLDWLRGVRNRHRDLLIENCSSGAMRMDYALLSLLELQSTSDQMDPALYAPIAAAAPASLTPEQAGNWAYPQPGMPPEEIAFCLVTGLAGRLYLSGHLNRMSADELALVREGVLAYEGLRADLAESVPFWPLGLPTSLDDVVVLGLRAPAATYLYVWFPRPGAHGAVNLPLPTAIDGSTLETVYPRSLPSWAQEWDADERVLRLTPTVSGPTARVLRIT
ncbi:MAG TPA: glycoside hydrolase family 36 protein [Microlunatus sp.]